MGHWIPITILSHLLTATQWFGLNSGMHHLVNVFLHLIAAVLLLTFLERATGERLASAFVAILFAVHPLHVESVAWVTERKDVLSANFFCLALLGYLRYTARPSIGRYLLVLVPFGLGLLAKPMLVTFPFLLLLIDFWPLRRSPGWLMVWEKLPLLLLSIADAAGTYWLQHVRISQQSIPRATLVSNAIIGYVIYLRQTFWPVRLAVFYPYSRVIGAFAIFGALAIVVIVTRLVIAHRRTRPWLTVGWFWYLGMLLPVIGFVQSGDQAHADHYTLSPLGGNLHHAGLGRVGRQPPLGQSGAVDTRGRRIVRSALHRRRVATNQLLG